MAKEVNKKKSETKKVQKQEIKEDVKRGIVRIAGVDILGNTKLFRALWKIKGISFATGKFLSALIEKKLGISKNEYVGNLDDDQIAEIDKLLMNLDNKIMPEFLMNRRFDVWSGKSYHLVMNDLMFATKMSIERKKKMYSWQGYRHLRGKKVRGQRTKNTGRRGIAVGVLKSKEAKQSK